MRLTSFPLTPPAACTCHAESNKMSREQQARLRDEFSHHTHDVDPHRTKAPARFAGDLLMQGSREPNLLLPGHTWWLQWLARANW